MCTMNSPDDPLSQALRNLAAASPKGAPPELGDRLKGAFARHHSRRRKRIAALTGSVVLGLLLAFTLLWVRPSHLRPPNLATNRGGRSPRLLRKLPTVAPFLRRILHARPMPDVRSPRSKPGTLAAARQRLR